MKKNLTRFAIITIGLILMNHCLLAETDSLSCTLYMYSKTTVGCHSYVNCASSAGVYGLYTWNFDGATIVSGSGSGPYWVYWNTPGIKSVSVMVTYNGDTCSGSSIMHVVAAPDVYSVTGGGSYPQGGQGVHIYLSGSQLHNGYSLYLNGGSQSVASVAGTGEQLDFGLFTTPGTYKCKAHADSTQGTCMTMMNDSAIVTISGYVPGQYICMVSFDTTFSHNKIIWYKTNGQHIDHYNIYRQTYQYDIYAKIAEVPFSQPNSWIDTIADPLMLAYKYKVSGTDSLDNESPLSPSHKTIHLEVSPGVSGFNLIWNPYEGFPFATYRIHRKLGSDSWQVIDSIASDLISYTDQYITSGLAYYYIEVLRPYPCYQNFKSDPNSSVVSNIGISAPVSIDAKDKNPVLIWPNPTCQTLNVLLDRSGNDKITCQLFMMEGRKVAEMNLSASLNMIDISYLTPGLYLLMIVRDQSIIIRKIVKE
jgi:hypothetical protein